jgi:prepilin-type N-terminal cleavage/methylation domain-containing protein
MKSSGFTLIELLIAIGILGLLIGLVWTAYARANQTMHSGEQRIDNLSLNLRTMNFLTESLQAIDPEKPHFLDSLRIEFFSRFENQDAQIVCMKANPASIMIKIFDISGRELAPERRLDAEIKFRFWNGTQWVDQWSRIELPECVSVKISPFGRGPVEQRSISKLILLPGGVPHLSEDQALSQGQIVGSSL